VNYNKRDLKCISQMAKKCVPCSVHHDRLDRK